MSAHGHHFNKYCRTWVSNAVYQVPRSSAFLFKRWRFLEFESYMGMAVILVMSARPFENFCSFIPRRLHMKFGFNRHSRYWGKEVINLCDLEQGQCMTLNFGTHKASCTHFVYFIYKLWFHRLQLFLKTNVFLAHWWPYRIGRPPSSVLFSHLLLRNHWASQSHISFRASMGWGNESLSKWSWSHDQDCCHAHIW